MPEPTPDRAPHPGFFEHATAWLGTLLAHLRVRIELAEIEGKEAAVHYGVLLGLAVAGFVFVVFGYLFLCLALVFLIANAVGGSHAWLWAALAMAGAHFAGVIFLALALKAKLATVVFPMTTAELKKDQEWLDQQKQTKPQS